ncbi:metallophosphoesterase family protein [Patescibacteria group bacterium]
MKKKIAYFSIALFPILLAASFGLKNISSSEGQNSATASVVNESFSFVVIGDTEREKDSNGFSNDALSVFNKARELQPDLVFFTGDIITISYVSLSEGYRRIKNIKHVIDSYFGQIPYYFTLGHHDVDCGPRCAAYWSQIFFNKTPEEAMGDKLYASFDHNNTHFVLLSNEYPLKHSLEQEQLNWLDQDLAATDKRYKIVLMHVPPVTFFGKSANNCHDMSCSEPARSQLISILQKHSVDLVISGHEHLFDHKIENGIHYVLSGNASGSDPRYKNTLAGKNFLQVLVTNYGITLRAITDTGEVIKEIKIK